MHVIHLGRLFESLNVAGLTCKKNKCSLGRVKLIFFGHIVGRGIISVLETRMKAIRKHQLPKTTK